jgi:hypothetical protein
MTNAANNFVKTTTTKIEEKLNAEYAEQFKKWVADEQKKFEEEKKAIEAELRVKLRKELEGEVIAELGSKFEEYTANAVKIKAVTTKTKKGKKPTDVKATDVKRGRTVRQEGKPSPTEFIRSCSPNMKAAEVVASGAAAGLIFSIALVYNTRKNDVAKNDVAKEPVTESISMESLLSVEEEILEEDDEDVIEEETHEEETHEEEEEKEEEE